MKLSLIICTRNRGRFLPQCLSNIPLKQLEQDNTELLLVNNGSTDNTANILQDFASKTPTRIKVISEPDKGLSRARNAGLRYAQGELIAFTDDDCYLGGNYFNSVIESFKRLDIDYCGGRILRYDPEDAHYGCCESDKLEVIRPFSFIPAGKIQGANMIFRRRVIEKIGEFDTLLGAGTNFRCEDIDYAARASLAGFKGAYVPEIIVYHHHRRKAGAEIQQLMRANDYARGAYYAKFILKGYQEYFRKWYRFTCDHKAVINWKEEVRGATHYIFTILKNNFSKYF